jgi:hypothetical protein
MADMGTRPQPREFKLMCGHTVVYQTWPAPDDIVLCVRCGRGQPLAQPGSVSAGQGGAMTRSDHDHL